MQPVKLMSWIGSKSKVSNVSLFLDTKKDLLDESINRKEPFFKRAVIKSHRIFKALLISGIKN